MLNHDAVILDRALPSNLKSLCLGRSNGIADNKIMMDISWDGVGGFIKTFNSLESLTVYCPLASGVDERLSFQSLHTLRLHEFYMQFLGQNTPPNERVSDSATVPEILLNILFLYAPSYLF